MDLSKDDVALIRTLGLSKSGLHIYTVFRRAGLSAPSISKSIARLERSGLINVSEDVVSLTDKGRVFVSSRPSLLLEGASRLKARLGATPTPPAATEFKGPTIAANMFYVPRTSELPRSLLKKIADAAQ